MIDGYIQKVKQVAALLDYGEPQILELFKNTLPSRLYYMLYLIDNLRVAVETAKRLLAKEQMDKKAGQSTVSLFMQVNQGSSKSTDKTEKKVSFSAVEDMERTTDNIERLAPLMDKMDTKLDRREDQYRSRVYQGRSRGCGYRQNNYGSKTDHIVEISIKITIGEETTTTEVLIEITGSIIGITVDPEIGTVTEMAINTTIDQIIEGKTVTKGMVIETRTMEDPEIEIEIGGIEVAPMKVLNPEAVVDPKTGMRVEGKVEMTAEIGTGLNQDLDPLLT